MKLKIPFCLFTFLGTTLLAAATVTGGPKGGRLLEAAPLKAEFFVNAEHRAEVTFYDAALKPVAPNTQVITVIAEPADGRTTLELEKTAGGFVSKSTLPGGGTYRVVVQIRATPDATPQNFRLDLNLAKCGECQRAEYACTCEGH